MNSSKRKTPETQLLEHKNAKRSKRWFLYDLDLHGDVLSIINDYSENILIKVAPHLMNAACRLKLDLGSVLAGFAGDGDLRRLKETIENNTVKRHQYADAMYRSCANGHLNIVKYLISLGADVYWAVHFASMNGHLDIMKYLVSSGTDITANNNHAVRLASQCGHLDVVKYLVSVGADITALENNALSSAAMNGHLDVVKYLVSVGATNYNSAVRAASWHGHMDVVRYLVSV